jgi:hypothetical protein
MLNEKRYFMGREYVREYKILDKTEFEKDEELAQAIKDVKIALANMHNNLQYASSDLIDYYTYQIKASRAKIDYLVKKAKEKGLALDMIEQIDIRYNKAI